MGPSGASVVPWQIQTKSVAQCVEYYYIWKKMVKFDCGRMPGLEKRARREPEEVERQEEKVVRGGWQGLRHRGAEEAALTQLPPVVSASLKVTCSPRERPSHRPTPEFKIKTKSYRRESILNSSPNAGPKRTPEAPGSVEGQGVFPCRECERYPPHTHTRESWQWSPQLPAVPRPMGQL